MVMKLSQSGITRGVSTLSTIVLKSSRLQGIQTLLCKQLWPPQHHLLLIHLFSAGAPMDELNSAPIHHCDEATVVNNCEDPRKDPGINAENQQGHEQVAHSSKDVPIQQHPKK